MVLSWYSLLVAVWQYLHLGHSTLSCQMSNLQRRGNVAFLLFAVDSYWIKFCLHCCAMQSQSYDTWVHSWLSTAQKSCITCFWEEQAIDSHHRHHRVLGQKVCMLAPHLEWYVLQFSSFMFSTFCLAAWKISALLSTSSGRYLSCMCSSNNVHPCVLIPISPLLCTCPIGIGCYQAWIQCLLSSVVEKNCSKIKEYRFSDNWDSGKTQRILNACLGSAVDL